MKKVFFLFIFIAGITGCKKNNSTDPIRETPVTTPPPQAEAQDSTPPTPFLQRIKIQITETHADSAVLQLPSSYYAKNNTTKYPLLLFFNGMYEGSFYGTLQKMLKLGPPKFMADSLRFSFTVNGNEENLIVVCPQSENGYQLPVTTNQLLDYMIAHYNIDTTRIYLTGLSAGAGSMLRYLADAPENARRIAAAVPMSTNFIDSAYRSKFKNIADAKVPLYWFCGSRDTTYLPLNQYYVSLLNKLSPGLVTFQLYNGSHSSWNNMYDPSHTYYNPNMYEWLLQFKR